MAKSEINASDVLLGTMNISPDSDIATLQKALLGLQYKELKEKHDTEAENKRILEAARKQGADLMLKEQEDIENKKKNCPHRKPNLASALSGQRDHAHNTHYICAYCASTFTDADVPPLLRPSPEVIGGPQ